MLCPDCGHDNIAGVDLCEECGQTLVLFDSAGDELEVSISRHPIDVLNPRAPAMVGTATSTRDAVGEMVERGIGCLLVEQNGALVGIVTERDILNRVSADPQRCLQRPVSEFMTPAPETITRQDSIAYALHAMDLGGYRHIPVVDVDGRPIGIISVRDILRFLAIRFAQLRSETE